MTPDARSSPSRQIRPAHTTRPDGHRTTDPALPGCALDACPDAVISHDQDGTVTRWNHAAACLLGLDSAFALGRQCEELLSFQPRDTTGGFPERRWAVTPDGVKRAVEVTQWHGVDHGVLSLHLWLRDASARMELESEQEKVAADLRREARLDALTGLANRYEFEDRLEDALRRHDAPGELALVVIDIDGFKPINDTHGHAIGDEVLAAVALRLTAAVRDGDTVARFGGDEFVVLCELNDGCDPGAMATRVRNALTDPVSTTVGPLTVSASVGFAVDQSGSDSQDLLRRADKAMYRSKPARRSRSRTVATQT
jgi:diguanylate cyclase (GGDEF)-like protein